MCTAIFYKSSGSFFGRTLDHAHSYSEAPMMIRKGYGINLRYLGELKFGEDTVCTGIERRGFPLIFDGINGFGVAIAGLNFPDSARFYDAKDGCINLASYELIPYILATARSTKEAYDILTRVNVTADKFDTDTPAATLHFMIADKTSSIIAEQTEGGMHIYTDRFGTLTNEPAYPKQCLFASSDGRLPKSEKTPIISGEENLAFDRGGSDGFASISSEARFRRAAFGLKYGKADNKNEALATAMHVLESVSVIKGTARAKGEDYKTRYLSVADLDSFSYYYKGYSDVSPRKITRDSPPDKVLGIRT